MRVSINQKLVSFRIWRSVLALPGTGSRTFLMPTNVTPGTMLHPSCGLGGLPLQDPSPHMAVELTKQATSFSGFLECRSETDIWRYLTAVTSGHLLFCVCVRACVRACVCVCVCERERDHRDACACYVRHSAYVKVTEIWRPCEARCNAVGIVSRSEARCFVGLTVVSFRWLKSCVCLMNAVCNRVPDGRHSTWNCKMYKTTPTQTAGGKQTSVTFVVTKSCWGLISSCRRCHPIQSDRYRRTLWRNLKLLWTGIHIPWWSM
jgi:hypothetical protein